jgi:hypothetical protein
MLRPQQSVRLRPASVTIQSAAPITIATSPLVQDLMALFPGLVDYAELKVGNAATNPVQVGIGQDLHWVDSWGADVFRLNGNRRVTFIPQAIQSPAPAAVPTSSLLLSVSERVCEIPGTYPTAMARAVAAAPHAAPLPTYSFSGAVSRTLNSLDGFTESVLYLYHPASVNERIRVRRVLFSIGSCSQACTLTVAFGRITVDPGIGGGAATIVQHNADDPAPNAADEFCATPNGGTAGVGNNAIVTLQWALGVSAAPTDVTKLVPIEIYNWADSPDIEPPTIRPNQAEGFSVTVTSNSAIVTVTIGCSVLFTIG